MVNVFALPIVAMNVSVELGIKCQYTNTLVQTVTMSLRLHYLSQIVTTL